MIRIDLTSPDVDKQAEILRHFPEITAKHYKPALTASVQALENAIVPNVPLRTGRAMETFGSKVSGRGLNSLRGQVGWFDQDDPFYVRIIESGATSHTIAPRGGRLTRARASSGKGATTMLAWPGAAQGGDFVFARSVSHPGFSQRGFMAAGYSAGRPIVESELKQAGDAVVAELAAI